MLFWNCCEIPAFLEPVPKPLTCLSSVFTSGQKVEIEPYFDFYNFLFPEGGLSKKAFIFH